MRNFSLISQPGVGLGADFECLENGATVPKGSYLSWGAAWSVVESFLQSPETRPEAINWVDADSLEWPEDY